MSSLSTSASLAITWKKNQSEAVPLSIEAGGFGVALPTAEVFREDRPDAKFVPRRREMVSVAYTVACAVD